MYINELEPYFKLKLPKKIDLYQVPIFYGLSLL